MAQKTQVGSVALVADQQSYAIVFPVAFSVAPTFIPTVNMPNDSGEVFEATADLSTLTATGVTVWLSGVPTAASFGGTISWLAIGVGAVVPPSSDDFFTGITTVQLCNRIGRRARGGDFTKLSMNGKQDILEAANAAQQRLYNALPTYFKEQTQGFVLPAPLAITGVTVTQYGKTVGGISFTSAQFGMTVVLDGDPGWNQIIGTQELLNPYMGSTGAVAGTIYGDAIHSTTFPLDRIIGNPQFANQNLFPLMAFNIAPATSGYMTAPQNWIGNVGLPAVWWPQVFGNSQGNRPIMVLKFTPAPNQAYAVNVRIGFWPKRLTLDDYAANTQLPVPDQFIEPSFLPMCNQEFATSPEFNPDNDSALIQQRGDAGERYARLQLGQVGSPSNKVGTPCGY